VDRRRLDRRLCGEGGNLETISWWLSLESLTFQTSSCAWLITGCFSRMASEEKKKKTPDDADSDYDSEDDADFQDDVISNSSSDESDAPKRSKAAAKDLDSGDEVTISKRKKKRKETENKDDLILTRAQRRSKYLYPWIRVVLTHRAEEVGKAQEKAPVEQDKPEDLDVLWEKLNQKPAIETSAPASSIPASTDDTIKIKRTYEFAGQTITEEKEVAKDSAEAKAYLASIHTAVSTSTTTTQSTKPTARRPVKRKSNLEEMAKGGRPAKLNVLEKSRLDWAGFVDKEGIHDDLKRFNKDGYVERQEFLKRTR